MSRSVIFVLLCLCPHLCAHANVYEVKKPIPVTYAPQQLEINSLPSPFEPLSDAEKNSNSGRELFCGIGFLKNGDLFQAVTALKRAKLFAQDEKSSRQSQIDYTLMLTHYLSFHYEETIETFEKSLNTPQDFRARQELQLILLDSYIHKGDWQNAEKLIDFVKRQKPPLATKMEKYKDYMKCNLDKLPKDIYTAYMRDVKSPKKAALYNALLPGAGYAYTGEPSTALSSFLINAIFIAATYEFAHAGQTGAAIISGSLECGWYFGGMYGAYLSAEKHNAAMYQELARKAMISERIFPIMQLTYGF